MPILSRTMLVILVAALVAVHVPPAFANHAPIQPGAQMSTTSGSCTLNFVFDGAGHLSGRVFIGTAAHCVRSVGQNVNLAGHPNAGQVFYLGDVPASINGDGRGDNGIPGQQLDFALIEVTNAPSPVIAAVKGHAGTPKGSTVSSQTALGDQVFLSGYGTGFSLTPQTREMRTGVLWADSPTMYNVYAPALFGDSGGPVLHASDKALGIASTVGTNGLAGPTVQGVLAELAALDIPIELRDA